MASLTDICNRALSEIGQEPVLTILEDSKSGRALQRAWPIIRDQVLRLHPWNCATERVRLAADAAAPVWGWDYQYTMPLVCLRVLEVNTIGEDGWQWEVEGRKILTDLSSPIDVRYIKQVTETGLYDPLLTQAMITRLALSLSEEFTQSNTKKEQLKDDWDRVLAKARGVDAQESSPMTFEEDSWITARE